MKGANEIMVEYIITAISEKEIVDWAEELLLSTDPLSTHVKVIQLAELRRNGMNDNEYKPGDILKDIVAEYYADFKIPSFETENYARQALRKKCAEYLVGKLHHPKEILVLSEVIAELFNNPQWLGYLPRIADRARHSDLGHFSKNEFKNEIKDRLLEL